MPAELLARAAFLDRDGTVIVEKDYLADPALLQFVDGAIAALRTLRDAGYMLVIVTNQSGIARGLYRLEDYRAVEARLEELLAEHDVVLDGVFFCPHHPDHTGPCDCRKPGLGMYREAARKLRIDLANSVYVGDRVKDVEPAQLLGGRGILVRTGYGSVEAAEAPAGIEVAANLPEAADMIVGKTRTTP
jgi:D,D-heptose 1,7-bisphosphate phosphatase